ncbi:MAG: hypothetical protein AAF934_03140 [Bacteroidota bacterium]
MSRWLFGLLGFIVFFISILPISHLIDGNFGVENLLGIPILVISIGMIWIFWTNKFAFYGELTDKESKEESERKRKDLGHFTYSDDGFEFKDKNRTLNIKWSDIEEIEAYKRDIYYVDQIVLQLRTSNKQKLIITEDTAGYYQFAEQINKNLDGVLKMWDLRVIFPAFEESDTLIYFKGRNLNEET